MLNSIERDRLKQGQPVSLLAIASAWAERRIEMGLASYIQVHTLKEEIACELQQAVRIGRLHLYNTTLEKERPYRAADEEQLVDGYVQLLPKSVDAWLDDEGWRPTLATPCIQPPHGWTAQSLHGLQRFDDSDAGRLVRLADLVQWLVDTKEMPCKAAVESVCSVLEECSGVAAGWLYLLTEADYAQPLLAEHPFFVGTFGEMEESDKGLPGAIKYMRQSWGNSREPLASTHRPAVRRSKSLDPLAIRLEVAHLWFDYGRRIDMATNVQPAAPAVSSVTARKGRRDLLYPLIEAAQKQVEDKYDAPAVFDSLRAMAEEEKRPFLGVTEDGIKWTDAKDETQFLTLKNLRDRLGRLKKKTR